MHRESLFGNLQFFITKRLKFACCVPIATMRWWRMESTIGSMSIFQLYTEIGMVEMSFFVNSHTAFKRNKSSNQMAKMPFTHQKCANIPTTYSIPFWLHFYLITFYYMLRIFKSARMHHHSRVEWIRKKMLMMRCCAWGWFGIHRNNSHLSGERKRKFMHACESDALENENASVMSSQELECFVFCFFCASLMIIFLCISPYLRW